MPPRRLAAHPLTRLERGPPITIRLNGRRVPASEGEPVAVALYAAGRTVLSRSMRYHRPRGLFCATGGCTHCFQRIDGVPNARGCETTCHANTWAEDQNAFPNAGFDVLAAADLAYPRYLDAHHAFVRPAFLKPVFTRVIRAMAGFGRVPKTPVAQSYGFERVRTDVCVVGSGPAGLAAAEAALDGGARVLVLERESRIGGRLRHVPSPFANTSPDAPVVEGKEWADAAHRRLREKGVEFRTSTRLFGIYAGARLAAASDIRLLEVEARSTILATGALDGYEPFPGSDRAGVLLQAGALRLLNEYGVVPGERVVVLGATRSGLMLANNLAACDVTVVVADPRPERASGTDIEETRRLGVRLIWNARPVGITGAKRPRRIHLLVDGRPTSLDCDSVVHAGPRHPAVELFQQAGCRLDHRPELGGFFPIVDDGLATTKEGVYAAGSALGVRDEWASHLSGRLAGLSAAARIRPDPALEERRRDAQRAWTAYARSPAPLAEVRA